MRLCTIRRMQLHWSAESPDNFSESLRAVGAKGTDDIGHGGEIYRNVTSSAAIPQAAMAIHIVRRPEMTDHPSTARLVNNISPSARNWGRWDIAKHHWRQPPAPGFTIFIIADNS